MSGAGLTAVDAGVGRRTRRRRRRRSAWWRALGMRRTQIGLALACLLVLVAAFGPLVAPHSPTEFIGRPYSPPSASALLGTDAVGRDVLSRVLYGGRSVIGLALLATVLGVVLGVGLGLGAAYFRGATDATIMRLVDVALAFPQVVFVLLMMSALGSHVWLLVLTVGLTHAPRVARVIRGTAVEIVDRDFVLAAEAIGESRWRVIAYELLPNVSSVLLVEAGLRMTYSIGLVAGISFLGFGLQPPSSDWGLMINENRLGIIQQPWAVIAPIGCIGLLTIGTNLVTDGLSRASLGIERSDGGQG